MIPSTGVFLHFLCQGDHICSPAKYNHTHYHFPLLEILSIHLCGANVCNKYLIYDSSYRGIFCISCVKKITYVLLQGITVQEMHPIPILGWDPMDQQRRKMTVALFIFKDSIIIGDSSKEPLIPV
jgi:hypothetical protein